MFLFYQITLNLLIQQHSFYLAIFKLFIVILVFLLNKLILLSLFNLAKEEQLLL